MTTYYVDSIAGLNTNAGTSSTAPWQTLGKVNAATLIAGDRVLFARGRVWTATSSVTGFLAVSWSGSAGAPITFGAYGTGPRPILDAAHLASNAIYNTGHSYLTFQDLDLRNGVSSGLQNVGAGFVDVINCVVSNAGNDNVLFIDSCHDCRVLGLTSTGAGYGQTASGVYSGLEIADGGTNFLIADCQITACQAGIAIHAHYAKTTACPDNITIQRCSIWNCGWASNQTFAGIQLACGYAAGQVMSNVVIDSCAVANNQGYGISVGRDDATNSGYLSGAITISRCVSYGHTQYNYHVEGDDVRLVRCRSFKGTPTTNKGIRLLNALRTSLYHCTLYAPVNPGGFPLLFLNGARTNNATVKNCIVAGPAGGTIAVSVDPSVVATAPTLTFDYNLYQPPGNAWKWNGATVTWVTWQTSVAGEAHSMSATDPKLVDPANGNCRLQAGSPAINAGIALSGVNDDAVGVPDLGCLEVHRSRRQSLTLS